MLRDISEIGKAGTQVTNYLVTPKKLVHTEKLHVRNPSNFRQQKLYSGKKAIQEDELVQKRTKTL